MQLIVCKHMWHAGQPFEGQCEGCTATIWDHHGPSYLQARGVSFAVLRTGPWAGLAPYRAFMGCTHPWFSVELVDDALLGAETEGAFIALLRLLDMTAYGRQEAWEDSPDGWPRDPTSSGWSRDGRPVPRWRRPGATPVDASAHHLCSEPGSW